MTLSSSFGKRVALLVGGLLLSCGVLLTEIEYGGRKQGVAVTRAIVTGLDYTGKIIVLESERPALKFHVFHL